MFALQTFLGHVCLIWPRGELHGTNTAQISSRTVSTRKLQTTRGTFLVPVFNWNPMSNCMSSTQNCNDPDVYLTSISDNTRLHMKHNHTASWHSQRFFLMLLEHFIICKFLWLTCCTSHFQHLLFLCQFLRYDYEGRGRTARLQFNLLQAVQD